MKTQTGSPHRMLQYEACSLESPARCHFCQVHQNESSLTAAAIRYLRHGAVSGENLMLITSKSRQAMILNWLAAAGVDVDGLKKSERLYIHTSQDVINALFSKPIPEWEAFEGLAAEAVNAASHNGEKRVRFYGDAVSDLWTAGNHAGAIVLEEFWARLKLKYEFDASFFCGYVIDALSPASYSSHLPHLGRSHSSVMPAKDSIALTGALDHAGREILGITVSKSAVAEHAADEPWRHRLPLVFEAGAWLSRNHPAALPRVLDRARCIYAG